MRFLFQAIVFFCLQLSHSQDFSYYNIPEELLKNSDAVVRQDLIEVTIESQKAMRINSTRVVTVLNGDGNRFVQAREFYDNHSKITHLEAHVYDATGNRIKSFKERDFIDQSATGGGTLYSDSRVKYLRFTPTSYPYTIVFKKSYKTSDTGFVPSWFFLDGYRVSTQMSRYTLNLMAEIPFRVKENNLKEFGVVSRNSDRTTIYEAENIPAIKREPYAPRFTKFAPSIKVALNKFHLKGVDGHFTNWESFGKWIYDSLLHGQDQLDAGTKAKIKQLVSTLKTPREKIQAVYQYVQNNTRYISVQLEIGGWKPISAIDVDRVKYGDCKGLTIYTMALLREAGFESYYTLVYAGQEKRDLDPDFPAIQGNHAFLNVPLEDEEIWLECTNQETPADYLGTFTDDRYVLKVTPEGGQLIKSRKYPDEANRKITTAEILINNDGELQSNLKIRSNGTQYGRKLRLTSNDEGENEAYYKEEWSNLGDMQLKNIEFRNDKDKIEFEEVVTLTAKDFISKAGEKWLFAPNLFDKSKYVPKRMRTRNLPIVIRRGHLDEDEYIIKLPENLEIESLLPEVDLKTDFGQYSIKMEKISDKEIRYQRRLHIFSGDFPKEKYKEFRDFKKKIALSDNAKIILTKT